MASGDSAAGYRITVTKPAQRDLKRLRKALGKDQFAAIDREILALANEPRPIGYEPISGQPGIFRVRVGDFRILYAIDDAALSVRVARIRDRKDVYRH